MSKEKTIKNVSQTCTFHAVGKSEKELLAYDEYDSKGSGIYFTDDLFMCNRYLHGEAYKIADKEKLRNFEITITKTEKQYNTKIDDLDSYLESIIGDSTASCNEVSRVKTPKKYKGKGLKEL